MTAPPQPLSTPADLEHQLNRFAVEIGELYRAQKDRAEELESALVQMRTTYLETVRSMAYVVEAKDAYTGQHLERCRVYGNALMDALGVASEYPDAEYGFLLHDVGKVGVPERILNKPGPLSAAEWRVMRTHPIIGYQILQGIPFMTSAASIVRCHHEMWDGAGYPEGLCREEIPLPARVFQVVDAFDAMTTDRPY
ncbi:MAG: ribonuclease protein subunit, partial [Actinomycetota bacterium]